MKNKKIFIAGHRGMVGSSVLSNLKSNGYTNLITATKEDLDLRSQSDVDHFFKHNHFDSVILCAAKVGGIMANNTYRGDFIYDNLQISLNIIKSSHDYGVRKLINLGSSCIYPRDAKIPIKEEYLLTGSLEYTNEPYAIAKIAALKACESFYNQYGSNFFSIMPCNLYGPGDNFSLKTSHVLPAFINKAHNAKIKKLNSIEIWGSGKPLREFLFVEDLSNAIRYCLENTNASDIYSQGISHLNCGSDDEVSIRDLMNIVSSEVGIDCEVIFDSSKPDGTFRKKMDNTRINNLGFKQKNNLFEGIKKTYEWYLNNV